mmetsp:Transcript_111841/g.193921  ORF Transcript_111841/g.193921 Transcript_111841/m.193921 type:complete len:326 (-) Transcript_111841:34-1011(-)
MGNPCSSAASVPSQDLEVLQEKSEHNPGQFQEGQFVNKLGLTLHTYVAPPQGPPRGVVVTHHGIRAHALYEILTKSEPRGRVNVFPDSLVDVITRSGFYVYAYDCEGHGLSESRGDVGYFQDVDDLVDDFIQLVGIIRRKHSLPVFGVGASMGAGVVCGVGTSEPPVLDGMVLMAPMISVEQIKSKPINKILIPIAGIGSVLIPKARIVDMEKNPNLDARYTWENDPLTDSSDKMFVAPSYAAMCFSEELFERLDEVQVPFLTIHSKDDTFTDYESSVRLMADAEVKDKTFLEPPAGSGHALLVEEVSREWTRAQIIDWLLKRTK